MSEQRAGSPADVSDTERDVVPPAPAQHNGAAVTRATLEEERRRKRGRDAAYGPSTPKGEGEEGKTLGGVTPLAKKGRVQDSQIMEDKEPISDSESLQADDDNDASARTKVQTTPPPAGLEATSAPGTPIVSGRNLAPRVEGTETRQIRQRVEALEWDDSNQPTSSSLSAAEEQQLQQDKEMELADVAAQVGSSAEKIQAEDEENVEIADVAAEVSESAERVDGSGVEDVEIANVAAEVGSSAEAVQQKDVEISEVADEVAGSAAKLDETQDKLMVDAAQEASVQGDNQESAEGADEAGKSAATLAANEDKDLKEAAVVSEEVGESASLLDAKQAQEEQVADVAAEVAQSAQAVPDSKAPTPAASPAPAARNSFAAFSSAASPFSSVPAPAPPASPSPAAESQKPKSKTTFSSIPSLPTPSTPVPAARLSTTLSSTPSQSTRAVAPTAFGAKAPPPTPATPFGKPTGLPSSSGTAAAASPFSAFASSSGFGRVSSTPSSSTSGFGNYSNVTASPFAKVQAPSSLSAGGDTSSGGSATSSRKLGEPVEEDPDKMVFTEKETVTGEEADEMVYSVRAKLFVMAAGAWAERGTGVLKINVVKETDRTGARLVMRADATHRLLLNAVLFSGFSVEVSQEKYVRFAIIEANEPVSYMLRMGNPAAAVAFVKAIEDQVKLL